MSKSIVITGVAVAFLMTILIQAWYYAANIASMSEETRGYWKDGLLAICVCTPLITAIIQSLRAREKWWRSVLNVLCVVFFGTFAFSLFCARTIGIPFGRNSSSTDANFFVAVMGNIIALILCVFVFSIIGIALGGIARRFRGLPL